MKDNFDLKKFLKESKAIENLNPSLKTINEKEDKSLKENSLKSKIREMIIDELSEDNVSVGGDVRGTINPAAPITVGGDVSNPAKHLMMIMIFYLNLMIYMKKIKMKETWMA
jgi:hypothetical protein